MSDEPKYVWFARHLRRQIEEGTLKPGDRLPSRAQIKEQHQIAQPTIDRAQTILVNEGLIVRRERQGVFVAEPGARNQESLNDLATATASQSRVATATVGILTSAGVEVQAGHRQPGWADYGVQGSLAACRERNKHALFLLPTLLQGAELRQLLAYPPLGFVFSSLIPGDNYAVLQSALQAVQQSKQPIVVYGNDEEYRGFDRVASDHDAGCYQLTRWLIGRGCQRILPFWPPVQQGMHWVEERLSGYRRAMQETGLEPMPLCEVPRLEQSTQTHGLQEGFERQARHKAGYLAEFLGREQRCDAILEASDGEVPSTAAACRWLGYEPNREVLIAGYDNYWRDAPERAFEPTPPIATVDKHNWQIGHALVEVLLARVAGELGAKPELRLIEPELLPLDDLASETI